MPPAAHPLEEKPPLHEEDGKDLAVQAVSYEEARRLGDEICVKYKKAFDALKDR